MRHIDFSYNTIPLNHLDPLVEILRNLITISSVDFVGNELALNKFYRVKLSEIYHIRTIDSLEVKDFARKDMHKIRETEKLEKLIEDSKKEYVERGL